MKKFQAPKKIAMSKYTMFYKHGNVIELSRIITHKKKHLPKEMRNKMSFISGFSKANLSKQAERK